jgi:peptidoglycan/xylan/chitin deacetylase (PgdA/CDA1 family)
VSSMPPAVAADPPRGRRSARRWARAATETVTGAVAAALSPTGRMARLAVFSYHQVLERPDALRPGEPDEADFASDIATISRVFDVLPLEEAVRRLGAGTLPRRAACLTFDDGYANNHTVAAPVLEAYRLPATFFVAGGAVDEGIMWNDLVIEAAARREGRLVTEGVPGLEQCLTSADNGAAFVPVILDQLKYRPLAERQAAAQRLYRDNVGGEPPRLMMTREMVADLARRGFDIGGHTMTHPILAKLADDEARQEIRSCTRWIRDICGLPPKTFAYPNGRPGKDFSDIHKAMLQEAEYTVAVSTTWSVARTDSDPYEIPRVGPWWRQHRSLPSGLLRLYLASYLS